MYFEEMYHIDIVRIRPIAIFTIKDTVIEFGYVMEIVLGTTLRDLIKNDNSYWITNEDLIKTAICKL